MLPEKWTKSSPKSLKTCYAVRTMPFIIPNFLLALGQTVYEKSVTFLHPSLSWRPRGTHWVKVHQSGWWCIAPPLLSRCQISSRSDNPYTRYLLPKFVDFVHSVTRRQKNSKRRVSVSIPFGDNKQVHQSVHQATELTQNRSKWRSIVRQAGCWSAGSMLLSPGH